MLHFPGKFDNKKQLLSQCLDRPFPERNEAIVEIFLFAYFVDVMKYRVPPLEDFTYNQYSIHKTTGIDVFLSDSKNTALIVELKYEHKNFSNTSKTILLNTFQQSFTYLPVFRDKTIDVQWIKLLAVVVDQNSNVELMMTYLKSSEVQFMIKNGDEYFREHKTIHILNLVLN